MVGSLRLDQRDQYVLFLANHLVEPIEVSQTCFQHSIIIIIRIVSFTPGLVIAVILGDQLLGIPILCEDIHPKLFAVLGVPNGIND